MVKTLSDYKRNYSKAEVSEEEVMIGLRGLRVAQAATSCSLSWNQHGSDLNCKSSTGR